MLLANLIAERKPNRHKDKANKLINKSRNE